MKNKFTHIIYFLFVSINSIAQIGNNWHFGYGGGLDFNTGNSGNVPLTNMNSTLNIDEGCATISDSTGALLFYTNGKKVFNKVHALMLNGDSLKGNISAFQSSVIVPHPGNKNLYYLFTTDAIENNFSNGYNYHIIDITADNGKGAVISKNNLLSASCTERQTAIQHSNGNDVWLITNDNNSNTFRSWLISCNGLQPNPVTSNAGVVLNSFTDMNIGALKASPDGRKLCQTHFPEVDILLPNHFFQLFDFNPTTGVISNPQKLSFPNTYNYGCAFSPNSKLLYLSDANHKNLLQIDVTAGNTNAILASLDTIPCGYGLYGMQTGPDQKIYATRYGRHLSVINNPDIKGILCNFTDSSLYLQGAVAQINLPEYMNNSFSDPYSNFNFQVIDSCNGIVQFNAFTNISGQVSYFWNFGDGTTSLLQNPLHSFAPKDKLYTIRLKITSTTNCAPIYRSKILAPQGIYVVPDFSYSVECDSGKVSFTNTTSSYPYTNNFLWDFGDNNFSNQVNPVHQYSGSSNFNITLKVLDLLSCLPSSITKPLNIQTVTIQAPPDLTVNENEQVVLTSISNANTIEWSPSTFMNNTALLSPTITPFNDITYIVTARNDANCIAKDTVQIKVNPIRDIYIPGAFTPNRDGKNDNCFPTFSRSMRSVQFIIYNRWGIEVFKGTPQNNYTWNGMFKNTEASPGTYVWKFNAIKSDGIPVKKTGTLVLLK